MKAFLPALPLLLLLSGCTRDEPAAAAVSPPPLRVAVASVVNEEIPRLTEVTGTVRPIRRAVLAAKVMGAITELPVTLGQRVQSGDVLVKTFAGEATAQLAQARAQLNLVQRDLTRERDLLAKGASTTETVRNLEDRLSGYEAAVREAEAKLSYTELRAPFDGVIARKLVNAGDLASPGQALLEIEGSDDFEIEASIPDSLIAALKPGSTLACEVGGVTLEGRLREISSTADASTRSIGVKIDVPARAPVRSGQFTRVFVPGSLGRVLSVPVTAVSPRGQMERVFVVGPENRAILRLVKTGAVRGERVEILSGLHGGERVVVSPPANLREGQALEVER